MARPLTYVEISPATGWNVKPIFAWYVMWIGAFWDRKRRKLYVLPLPCIGIVITWPRPAARMLDQDSIDMLLGFSEEPTPGADNGTR